MEGLGRPRPVEQVAELENEPSLLELRALRHNGNGNGSAH
jgi:hypothetical protein